MMGLIEAWTHDSDISIFYDGLHRGTLVLSVL